MVDIAFGPLILWQLLESIQRIDRASKDAVDEYARSLERARRLFEHKTLDRARRNRSCQGATSPGTSPSSEPEKNQNSRPVLPLLPTDPRRGLWFLHQVVLLGAPSLTAHTRLRSIFFAPAA
jgi:hypothetical protein